MVGLGIYKRDWISVTLDIHWCELQWIDVMPAQRFAELMCVWNTTECNYMKMTLSDLWKNNFKCKLYHIRDILYPSAVMKGSLHSWFVSASHGVPLIPSTQIAAQNWDFLDVCPYLAVFMRLFTAEQRQENQLVIYHVSKRTHTGGSSGLKQI